MLEYWVDRLWELAQLPHTDTNNTVGGQIKVADGLALNFLPEMPGANYGCGATSAEARVLLRAFLPWV